MKKRDVLALCLLLCLSLCACKGKADLPEEESGTDHSATETWSPSLETSPATETAPEVQSTGAGTESGEPSEPSSGVQHIQIGETAGEPAEERETALELVQRFSIGEGGIFLHSGLGKDIQTLTGDSFYADEDGELYYCDYYEVTRLRDGARMDLRAARSKNPFNKPIFLASRGILYWMPMSGGVIQASFEHRMEQVYDHAVFGTAFCVLPGGKVMFRDGNGAYYTLDGKKVSVELVGEPTITKREFAMQKLLFNGTTAIYEERVVNWKAAAGSPTTHAGNYFLYGTDGTMLASFGHTQAPEGKTISCDVPDRNGGRLTGYQGFTVTVGKQTFEHCVDSNIFVSPDGTLYLAVVYAETGEVYKITPGYGDSLIPV